MLQERWLTAINAWARQTKQVARVYIVGSRAKGTAGADSDLDVALILGEERGYTDWFFESDRWRTELQSQLDVELDLLRGTASLGNPVTETAVLEHGILVFDRDRAERDGALPS